MGDTSWIYPSDKTLGSRTVWVWEDWETKEYEFFLPSSSFGPKEDPIRVDRIRSSTGVIHRISGGTEAARNRLLRECARRAVQAKLA